MEALQEHREDPELQGLMETLASLDRRVNQEILVHLALMGQWVLVAALEKGAFLEGRGRRENLFTLGLVRV